MKDILKNLEKVIAYSLTIPVSETEDKAVGIYNNREIALETGKKAGWYGRDGTVTKLENIFIDDDGKIYQIKELGWFTELQEAREKQMLESIISKLTPDELEFVKTLK